MRLSTVGLLIAASLALPASDALAKKAKGKDASSEAKSDKKEKKDKKKGKEKVAGAAEGKKALKKAKQLAGKGKCTEALVQFTKAYEVLKDPVLLFDRGECYRKTDDKANAVADYREFLAQLPNAPNRKAVEGRIAELSPPELTLAPVPPPPPPSVPPPPPPPPPVAENTPPPPPVKEPLLPLETGGPDVAGLAEPSFVSDDPKPDLVAAAPAPAPAPAAEDESVLGKWWFWTVVGAVVIGGGATAYVLTRPGSSTAPPMTALGNYKF